MATVCAKAVAEQFDAPVEQILPASTGVIGVELDPDLIIGNVPRLVNGLADHRFEDVARAMMTTDTVMKTSLREVKLDGGAIRIAGMTKGSGMIQPNMATTLGFVMTDADIGPSELRAMLADAVEYSYNRISVDGDTSTNDTVLLLANGASGLAPDEGGRELVREALRGVMEDLAKKIARDGEGARKLISIRGAGREERDRCATNRALHCEFASGEDCHCGLRSELGTHSLCGGKCGGGVRSSQRRYRDARRARLPRRICRGVFGAGIEAQA